MEGSWSHVLNYKRGARMSLIQVIEGGGSRGRLRPLEASGAAGRAPSSQAARERAWIRALAVREAIRAVASRVLPFVSVRHRVGPAMFWGMLWARFSLDPSVRGNGSLVRPFPGGQDAIPSTEHGAAHVLHTRGREPASAIQVCVHPIM